MYFAIRPFPVKYNKAPYYATNLKYHLHLDIGGYDGTSYGIVITKLKDVFEKRYFK